MASALRAGHDGRMAGEAGEAGETAGAIDKLRADLKEESYAILGVISDYDGRLMLVKGWSVTLSLTAVALGFKERHYALFGLGALTPLTFWYLDALLKGYQIRYYSRMRDIEVAAYAINTVHSTRSMTFRHHAST